MKKILLIVITSFAFTQMGNGGLNFGAFPGSVTFDSLVPGSVFQAKQTIALATSVGEKDKQRVVAGIDDPGKRRAALTSGRDHRSWLQPRFTAR